MDYTSAILNLLLVAFLVALNGFFVAAEFAIVKVRSSRIDTLVHDGNTRAKYAKNLVEHLDAYLSVTQLGITLASLGLGWIGEPAVARLIDPITNSLGLSPEVSHTVSFAVAFSFITALHIVLGELTPKSLAIQKAEGVVLWVAIPMIMFYKLMYPAVWFLNHVANWILRLVGIQVSNEGEAAHTEEEIRILMEESHKQGYIDQTELTFVDNIFDFAERNVREVMIPRTDMICMYAEDPFEENMKIALEEHLTRYPVCDPDKDNIIGFLHIKDLLRALSTGEKDMDIRSLTRKVTAVPESMPLSNLLKLLQKHRAQIAIVVDEYGGTAGMVTVEDILEEIVGEIQDEFDEERPFIEQRDDNTYSVDARLLLEEINDELEINLDSESFDTIGGWLYSRIEMPPVIDDKIIYEGDEFTVEEVDNVRITRILIKVNHPLTKNFEEEADFAERKEDNSKNE
ncbi:hemolysin family protein [Anaerosinus gibii]|uniref:Hemolysin family protein n=1 Tax=Selenobaculum gibii TaxID=3054208 RepID=A0A9Y2AKJ7_9FIRM|nr:hemolysin family protein [Selenobaculum gbiensis]WIW71235.1 hemolysin family protein [Selenobaculum gbiensis]